jgi:hypothetical protein
MRHYGAAKPAIAPYGAVRPRTSGPTVVRESASRQAGHDCEQIGQESLDNDFTGG